MKTVFDSRMVAHVWAQQSQPSGRSYNGHIFFEGATIYSYRHSFPMATFHESKKLGRVVLETTARYSITTSRHQSFTSWAIPDGMRRFHVNNPTSLESAKADYESQIREALINLRNAKRDNKRAEYHGRACHLTQEANEFADAFSYRWRLKMPAPLSPELIEKLKAEEKARGAKLARELAAKEKKRAADNVLCYAAWILGNNKLPDDHYFNSSALVAPSGGVALRVNSEELETSKGARVPLTHAVKAFRFIKLCKTRGQEWNRNGHSLRVGQFTVDSVTADGNIIAGCHSIMWPEIERVARLIGVYDEAADDAALTPKEAA